MTPSILPTISSSFLPSAIPSAEKSFHPSLSNHATSSSIPSIHPTRIFSIKPSVTTSVAPSQLPSDRPTNFLTNALIENPTSYPTSAPSRLPSDSPFSYPTTVPSQFPSDISTSYSTTVPSQSPSESPRVTFVPPSNTHAGENSTIPSNYPSSKVQLGAPDGVSTQEFIAFLSIEFEGANLPLSSEGEDQVKEEVSEFLSFHLNDDGIFVIAVELVFNRRLLEARILEQARSDVLEFNILSEAVLDRGYDAIEIWESIVDVINENDQEFVRQISSAEGMEDVFSLTIDDRSSSVVNDSENSDDNDDNESTFGSLGIAGGITLIVGSALLLFVNILLWNSKFKRKESEKSADEGNVDDISIASIEKGNNITSTNNASEGLVSDIRVVSQGLTVTRSESFDPIDAEPNETLTSEDMHVVEEKSEDNSLVNASTQYDPYLSIRVSSKRLDDGYGLVN